MTGRRLDVAAAVLGVLAIALVFARFGGPAQGLAIVMASMLVPGRAVAHLLRIDDPWAAFVLTVALSATFQALGAVLMVWTGLWHPRGFACVLLGISVASLLSRVRRKAPSAPAHRRPR
jgi:uncharacterized membrane-anchored protein